jgi:hypothetical protein
MRGVGRAGVGMGGGVCGVERVLICMEYVGRGTLRTSVFTSV